jgi:hypothetical protein
MRRRTQIFVTAALIGWVGSGLPYALAPATAATGPVSDAKTSASPVGTFDREALRKALSTPLEALEAQPTEALREYVQRLGDLHFALDLAIDVSPAERRALSEQVLTRVGQVGLLIRRRTIEPLASGGNRAFSAPGSPRSTDLAGVVLDNTGLLVRLLGGLLIAFSLGYLVRERRATRVSGALVRSGRVRESSAPVPVPYGTPGEGRPMTLEEIGRALRAGRTVLLQMGYEITPAHRRRFLALAREAQEILQGIEGQTYTVWEDPGHPNRFYELLVCRRLEVLDQLASSDGPLPKLAEQIEACRVPSGFSLHRAWLGALSDGQGTPSIPAITEDSLAP